MMLTRRSHQLCGSSNHTVPIPPISDLGKETKLTTVEVNWEYPPKSFSVETSADGHHWSGCAHVEHNDEFSYKVDLKAQKARKLRVVMNEPHPKLGAYKGHFLYGIQHLRVGSRPLVPIVEKCSELWPGRDQRDKWFLVEVSEFNPCKNPKLGASPPHTAATTKFDELELA